MNLPWKVSKGEQVSATWMNLVVDALKQCYDMQARRRILRGVGYTVSESPGGTSLTIDKQAVTRVSDDDLSILRNADFAIRIKPKGQCSVDVETGNWDKIVQVHKGYITNHVDINIEVTAKAKAEGEEESAPAEAGTAWDASEWVDLETLADLGGDGTETASEEGDSGSAAVLVYVKMTALNGTPTLGEFVAVEDETLLKDEEGVYYVPIGEVSAELVEETPRYYIKQHQVGPIVLGGSGAGIMPFDVSLVYKTPEQEEESGTEEEGEEPTPEPHVNVKGGRVFLPGNEYAEIPDKTDWQISTEGGFPQYVILTLTRDGSGGIKYRYEMAELPGTKVAATEDTGEAAS